MQLYDDPTTVSAPPALPAAGTPGYFTDGVPGTIGRTLIRAWWLNQVAEELVNIVTAAGLTPSRTVNNQVLEAIQSLTAVPQASHTVQGKVQLATTAQVEAGTDDQLATTSLGVASAIDSAIAAAIAPLATTAALNADVAAIDAALALLAPLASPALTGNPTVPTQAAGDDSSKIASTAYADRAVNQLFVSNVSTSEAGPWYEWNSQTQRVQVWGNYTSAISTEGEITVDFPVNIGTYLQGSAGTLNSAGSNMGSAVAQPVSATATTMTIMINDSQTSGDAYATGVWWRAEGKSATAPAVI